jgi:hypothetical protein
MLKKMQDPDHIKLFGTPAQLFEVLRRRTGVGGPNILGGSVTTGIRACPFPRTLHQYLRKLQNILKYLPQSFLSFLP